MRTWSIRSIRNMANFFLVAILWSTFLTRSFAQNPPPDFDENWMDKAGPGIYGLYAMFDIEWPMKLNGKDWGMLRIPGIYDDDGHGGALHQAIRRRRYLALHPQAIDLTFESIKLTALWPTMEPHTIQNSADFFISGGGRRMYVSIESGAIDEFNGVPYNKLNDDFKLYVTTTRNVCFFRPQSEDIDSLPREVCDERAWPDEKSPRFGLKRMGIDFSKYPDMPKAQYGKPLRQDIFYDPEPGNKLQTFIICTPEEAKTHEDGPQYQPLAYPESPWCQQKFIFKPLNALVSIGYRRIYLKDWQAIQAAWEELLQSFIVKTQTSITSSKGK